MPTPGVSPTSPGRVSGQPSRSTSAVIPGNVKPQMSALPELQPADLAAEIAKGGKLVVKFHSPACGYCRRSSAEFVKSGTELSADTRFFKMNLLNPQVAQIMQHFGGAGYYPIVAVFNDGQHMGNFNRPDSNDVKAPFLTDNVKRLLG